MRCSLRELFLASRGDDISSRVEMRVRVGLLWRTWISEHIAYEEGRMFCDIPIQGPFAR
jgi:ligand-binding SRPBCC domain-containing protein